MLVPAMLGRSATVWELSAWYVVSVFRLFVLHHCVFASEFFTTGDVQVRITWRVKVARCELIALEEIQLNHSLSFPRQLICNHLFDLDFGQVFYQAIPVASNVLKNVGEDIFGLETLKHFHIEIKSRSCSLLVDLLE